MNPKDLVISHQIVHKLFKCINVSNGAPCHMHFIETFYNNCVNNTFKLDVRTHLRLVIVHGGSVTGVVKESADRRVGFLPASCYCWRVGRNVY